jgi:acyl-CoA synthetase (AMP-forming)/AMP-acid ligase II
VALETLKDILLWLETQFGDKEAVADHSRRVRWSFGELNDRAREIAASFARDGGVRKGDRIGWLALGASGDIVALTAGALKLGAVPVIMNARASAERLAWMIDNAGLKSLAYSGDCAELLEQVRAVGIPSVRQLIALDSALGLPGEVPLDELCDEFRGAAEPRADIDPADVCLLAYTSGTTGTPKPVMHEEAEWSWTSLVMAYVLGLSYDDVTLVAMPPSFIGWAHLTCASLRVGAKQCCFRFDPRSFTTIVSEEQATHALLTPTMIRMLHAEYQSRPDAFSAKSLRASVIGGEPITTDVNTMADEMFGGLMRISALGATEGILLHSGMHSSYLKEHPATLGKPLPGVTVQLRDEETGEIVTEPGERGILYAKGPGIAAGIWNDPEATHANFPGGWWRTGDIFSRDEYGYYDFAGRCDHMFKSGAIKIYSEEVERSLKRHPAVLDAVVLPVPDATFGLVPFAHVRNSEPLTADAMERWWRGQPLESYSRPRHWKFWRETAFPMLTLAKVDRKRLAEDALTDVAGKRGS